MKMKVYKEREAEALIFRKDGQDTELQFEVLDIDDKNQEFEIELTESQINDLMNGEAIIVNEKGKVIFKVDIIDSDE